MFASGPANPPAPVTKFSRYRSVRKAIDGAHSKTCPAPPPESSKASVDPNIARGPSRYRRRRPEAGLVQYSTPVSQTTQQKSSTDLETPAGNPIEIGKDPFSDGASLNHDSNQERKVQRETHTLKQLSNNHEQWQIPLDRNRQTGVSTAKVEAGENSHEARYQDWYVLNNTLPDNVETDMAYQKAQKEDWLRRQRQRELERMQRDLSHIEVPPSPPAKERVIDRLALFGRRKTGKAGVTSSTKSARALESLANKCGTETNGGVTGVGPGIDAPVSAVNAGERRVKIKFDDALFNLPIDPETTAVDLILAISTIVAKAVNPETHTLLESFTKLGLERPLRRYERIRDVMNSWDRDTQNGLILVPAAKDGKDRDLKADNAPREQPEDCSVYLYYSQKPGSWNQRWVTLRTDGQIHVAKKIDAREKDLTRICHLSDFDVYTPTPAQLTKVKPPKRHCMAIKSQERSSMFLSKANFVHFFATDDAMMASKWYQASQQWRTWYLINKVGALEAKPQHTGPSGRLGSISASGGRKNSSSQRTSLDDDDIPLHRLLPPELKGARSGVPAAAAPLIHARILSKREKKPPPVSFPATLLPERPRASLDRPSDDDGVTFAPTGLLGRTYSQRRQKQREYEIGCEDGGPHSRKASLTHGGSVTASGDGVIDARSHKDEPSSGLKRNSSQRHPPKPLLDFSSPEYREAPQHVRKGRGVNPVQLSSGGLIDVATSPEQAIPIPPATTWRRPGTRDGSPIAGPHRTHTLSRSHANPFADDAEVDHPSQSMHATARAGAGGLGHGREVMSGQLRPSGPLLDLSEPSQYAPGSLLARVESREGPSKGPIVDRERR